MLIMLIRFDGLDFYRWRIWGGRWLFYGCWAGRVGCGVPARPCPTSRGSAPTSATAGKATRSARRPLSLVSSSFHRRWSSSGRCAACWVPPQYSMIIHFCLIGCLIDYFVTCSWREAARCRGWPSPEFPRSAAVRPGRRRGRFAPFLSSPFQNFQFFEKWTLLKKLRATIWWWIKVNLIELRPGFDPIKLPAKLGSNLIQELCWRYYIYYGWCVTF